MRRFLYLSMLLIQGVGFASCGTDEEITSVTTGNNSEKIIPSSIFGTVTYTGKIPKHIERDDAGYRRELLHVHPVAFGLANTIVYLIPTEALGLTNDDVMVVEVVTQEDFMFHPSVIGVRSGQRIGFTNDDPANHNVRANSEYKSNEFNVVITQQYGHDKVFNSQPNYRPVRLSCDIHRWMDGWIYVFEHPYYTVTDASGLFEIIGVAPGLYEIVLEQPDSELVSRGTVTIESGSSISVNCDYLQTHLYGKESPELVITSL